MRCVGIPAGFVFSEEMTSLEIPDMYFVKFDVFGQYLNNIWSMVVQPVSVQVYMSPNVVDMHFANLIHPRHTLRNLALRNWGLKQLKANRLGQP